MQKPRSLTILETLDSVESGHRIIQEPRTLTTDEIRFFRYRLP